MSAKFWLPFHARETNVLLWQPDSKNVLPYTR